MLFINCNPDSRTIVIVIFTKKSLEDLLVIVLPPSTIIPYCCILFSCIIFPVIFFKCIVLFFTYFMFFYETELNSQIYLCMAQG